MITYTSACIQCRPHRCGVCEALAKNAHRQIKALRDEHKGPRRVRQFDLHFDIGRSETSALLQPVETRAIVGFGAPERDANMASLEAHVPRS